MKCPKYTLEENKLHQKTLAESWFCKNNSKAETNHKNQCNENSTDTKFKSPFKSSKNQDQSQNSKSILSVTNNLLEDKENETNDNDIVASSQSINESKLRKKIGENLLRRSETPRILPQKVQNISTPISEQKLNISDLCNSSLIKDELVTDMYENVVGYEAIEMAHDLGSLLDDSKLISNILLSSPIVDMEMGEHQLEAEPLHDLLQINENDRIEYLDKSLPRKRTKSLSLDKSISKKVQYNLHDQEKGNSKRKSKSKNENIEDALPSNLKKKLKLLKIKLQHQVPPQHKIENNAGSRPLSEEQTKEFETYGPLKKGVYSEKEDETIRKNWKDFCKIHEWDENIVYPFLNMRHKGKYYITELSERKNFVRFLANGLPWRSLYSVYFRFRNLYNVTIGTGRYTAKEDKIIMSYMRNASNAAISNQCAEVAKILKRKKQSVWQHFQKLKKKHDSSITNSDSSDYETDENEKSNKKKKTMKKYSKNKKKLYSNTKIQNKIAHKKVYTDVKWTSPLVNKFIETLINVTSSDKVQDLKYKKIDESLWIKVEKTINVDRTILQNFWNCQLHLQLFSCTPIYLNDTKMKLIEYMHENKEKNLEDILWEDVCLNFDGITTDFLSKLFDQLVQHACSKIDSNNLKDIVQYLYEHHIPELENKTVDVILPKLYYKGGRIICIDKGTEKKILNRTTSDPLAEKDE